MAPRGCGETVVARIQRDPKFARALHAEADSPNRSQIVTGSEKRQFPRFLLHALPEDGQLNAANQETASQAETENWSNVKPEAGRIPVF
jgi:hypothetical protein